LKPRNLFLISAVIVSSIFSGGYVLAESQHITAAVRETKEAIIEGKQSMFSSFSEHTHNALDHTKEAIFEEKDPKGHLRTAKAHLVKAIKITKHTNHESRLMKGVREAEKALMHLKVANEQ
jgi:Small metal-binding protein